MATSANRPLGMPSWFWSAVSFLIGTILGTGSFWQWQTHKIDVQKLQLDTAVQTTELRKKENDQYAQIIDLTRRYVDARDQYSKSPSPQLNNQILEMKRQLDLVKDDFMTLENKLAQLEGRQPRAIAIDFVPPNPPTGLHAVVQ